MVQNSASWGQHCTSITYVQHCCCCKLAFTCILVHCVWSTLIRDLPWNNFRSYVKEKNTQWLLVLLVWLSRCVGVCLNVISLLHPPRESFLVLFLPDVAGLCQSPQGSRAPLEGVALCQHRTHHWCLREPLSGQEVSSDCDGVVSTHMLSDTWLQQSKTNLEVSAGYVKFNV